MAHIFADRVIETSTTTGTGNFTLAGAVLSYQTFASECVVGDTFPYSIEAVDASGAPTGAYETGTGTLLTTTTFSRVPETSSNSDALVSFAAGTKYVMIALTRRMVFTRGLAMAPILGIV